MEHTWYRKVKETSWIDFRLTTEKRTVSSETTHQSAVMTEDSLPGITFRSFRKPLSGQDDAIYCRELAVWYV